jgi:CubicO group peptidase (beta-lactamase class C family)
MPARSFNWLTALALAAGTLFAAGIGIFTFVRSTWKPPLHPNPLAIPSVQRAPAAARWTDAVKQSEQLTRTALAEGDLPGVSVAVGVDDTVVWAEGFGWADIEAHVPVNSDMRFRIGHASKALTSAAVGLLVERQQLRLNDQIQTYVPSFPRKQWPVTIRELMGHTAGIRHYRGETEPQTMTGHCETALQGLESFADDPLRFEPGTKYQYSTYGWVLVSAAVEAAAKEPYSAFMRQEVFAPLGMTATTFDAGSAPAPDRATFYEAAWNENRRPATPVDYSCLSGAGAILSTPSDLVRFGLAMAGHTLLTSATIRTLQSPQQLASGEETTYGLGWMLDTVPLAGKPTELVYHSGRSLVGGTASLLTFPDRRLVVAVTSNLAYGDARSIGLGIADAFARVR